MCKPGPRDSTLRLADLDAGSVVCTLSTASPSKLFPVNHAVQITCRSSGRNTISFAGPRNIDPSPCHEVQFYSSDAVLLEGAARFISTALTANNVAIVILTKSHREGLAQRLKDYGFDVDGGIQQGTYIPLDAPDMLSTIMRKGVPDLVRFFEGLCDLIELAAKAAKKAHPRIALCAECVGLLSAEGNTSAALQLEEVGGDLTQLYDVDILCAYPFSSFQGDDVIERICEVHTAVHSQ